MIETQRVSWRDTNGSSHSYTFRAYMTEVAQARYVIRKVQMIIDGCARDAGLGPLEHQALIQIYGAKGGALPVGQLAERLNVAPALASRLVQQLDAAGLATRAPAEEDRRTMLVRATEAGERGLYDIVERAHAQVERFRFGASARERAAAHEIIAFYVGSPES
ncbi:MarR family winged helix-turn-helix transcriptional regulator [Tardiphaga sp.]|jgi:DNA-binding MarR family transcriptional regulator|uniref:MarR family winged helix-turn-helix transcriptional regulator n=1 Tax=Tardiphaga sp. TaxID=1926292 RepID=UPI0037D9F035